MLVSSFFVVVFLSIVHQAKCVARTDCVRSGHFQKARTDHALINHVVATRTVLSRMDCLFECLSDQRCVSYNFQESPSNGEHTCELNDQKQDTDGVELQARSGYSYYESVPQDGVTPACLSSVCQNDGLCIDGCSNTYKCQCTSLRAGHYCEGWSADAHNYTLKYSTKSTSGLASSDTFTDTVTRFTLCSWLQTTAASKITLASYTSAANGIELALYYFGVGKTVMRVNGNDCNMFSAPLDDGKWHHLCVTWDNALGDWNFYVDGSRRLSGSTLSDGHIIHGGGNFVVGQFQDSHGGSLDSSKSFHGELSQLNVWGSVLNKSTILSLANYRRVLFGDLIDWRVFQVHATGSLEIVRPSGISGYNSYIVHFPSHSLDNYVQATIAEPLSAFTISLWAKLQDSVNVSLFSYTAEESNIALHFDQNPKLIYEINQIESTIGVERFVDNSWHHFCVLWRSSNGLVTIYVDGNVRFKVNSISVGQTIAANGVFTIGKKADANKTLKGNICGFNVWSYLIGGNKVTAMSKGSGYEGGDVLAWDSLKVSTHGGVVLLPVTTIQYDGQSTNYKIKFEKKSTDNYAKFSGRPIPDLTVLTACAWFNLGSSSGAVFSYATTTHFKSLSLFVKTYKSLTLSIQDNDIPASFSSDLQLGWFYVGLAWRSSDGECEIFINDERVGHVLNHETGSIIKGNGTFFVGLEMDDFGHAKEAFSGSLSHVNVWSTYFGSTVHKAMAAGGRAMEGNVVYWSDFRNHLEGDAQVKEPSGCNLASYTTQNGRNDECHALYSSSGSPVRAIFGRPITHTGRNWRCYWPSSYKLNNLGKFVYDISSGSKSYKGAPSLLTITD